MTHRKVLVFIKKQGTYSYQVWLYVERSVGCFVLKRGGSYLFLVADFKFLAQLSFGSYWVANETLDKGF